MSHWSEFIQSPSHFVVFVFCLSTAAGVLGSIFGLGGGIIVIPVLTLVLGINIRYAIGASIVSVIATSSGAAATYVKDRMTNLRLAMFLEVATTLGALCGAALSPFIATHLLYLIFAVLMMYSAIVMFRKKDSDEQKILHDDSRDRLASLLKLDSSYPDRALDREIIYRVTKVPFGFLLMCGAGVVSGLLGIGSGVLKVPAMDSAMNLPIKVSSATSNLMIGVTAAASAGVYYMRGDIIPILAAPVALGVLAGSQIGTRLMMRIHSQYLRRAFIFILCVVAVQMALKSFGINMR